MAMAMAILVETLTTTSLYEQGQIDGKLRIKNFPTYLTLTEFLSYDCDQNVRQLTKITHISQLTQNSNAKSSKQQLREL